MYPVLFHIGSFAVTGYAALIAIGMAAGAVLAYRAAQRRGIEPAPVLDASLVAALGGLIGGRAAYVAIHWAYYSDHMDRALRPWDGGLASHGALVGGLVAVLAYCGFRRVGLGSTLDLLTPGVAVVTACAWLGCFLNRCACGIEAYPGQGLLWALSLELPDLHGLWAPRVAVQLLGVSWSGAVLATVVTVRRGTWLEGFLFPLWLAIYSLGSFGLGYLRADEVLWVAGWRAGQVADLVLALSGLTTLAVHRLSIKVE